MMYFENFKFLTLDQTKSLKSNPYRVLKKG